MSRPPRLQPVGAELSDRALRAELVRSLESTPGSQLHEFSLPSERLRADLVVVGRPRLVGYEIKSAADRLTRLNRQVGAYQDVFSICHAVVAQVHLRAAMEALPPWWGVLTTRRDGSALRTVRRATPHDMVDVEVLVRLLWKAEAEALVRRLGVDVPPSAPRHVLWELLLDGLSKQELERRVSRVLRARRPADARIPARWAGTR